MNKENDIDRRFSAIEENIVAIEENVVGIQNAMKPYQDMFKRDDYKILIDRVEELQLLVLGEIRVGAKPLRTMVDEVYTAYSEFRLTIKQLKTLLGFFGVTTLAGIVAFVALLLKVLELIKEFP